MTIITHLHLKWAGNLTSSLELWWVTFWEPITMTWALWKTGSPGIDFADLSAQHSDVLKRSQQSILILYGFPTSDLGSIEFRKCMEVFFLSKQQQTPKWKWRQRGNASILVRYWVHSHWFFHFFCNSNPSKVTWQAWVRNFKRNPWNTWKQKEISTNSLQ